MKFKILCVYIGYLALIKCVLGQQATVDVCFNDDFDPVTNQTRKTVPYTIEELNKLLDDLNNSIPDETCYVTEKCAQTWMDKGNFLLAKFSERQALLSYNYDTNVTNENARLLEEFAPFVSNASRSLFENGQKFYKNSLIWSTQLRRMLYLTTSMDLTDPKVVSLINQMTGIYAKATVCRPNTDICYNLEPGITKILAESRDYSELLWVWTEWYSATGAKMKPLYTQLIDLVNAGAVAKGYNDASEDWMRELETDDFELIVDLLYAKLKPFYEQLHAYVRRKLRNFYGDDKFKSNKIPVHILGNMWGQSWDNIYDIVVPYQNEKPINVTEKLLNKGYTPLKLFQESERFFTSMGLCPMTRTFWEYSDIVKPNNTEFVCHASASDFSNNFDFRIKMCTEVNEEYFYTIHHEMGHIEYYMAYRNQPTIFRGGANSAFHEAIGDTVALSVLTTKHLKTIGLVDSDQMSDDESINFLMGMALKKIAFAPFGYLIDKWRWNVFRGVITSDMYNDAWWKMINDFQGLEAPVERSKDGFDAGGKYHIPANVPYIRYFLALFHQFQFYKGLCTLSNHTGPLHKCDFYNSKEAGVKFKEMLSLGSSQKWQKALKLLTGDDVANTDALFEYFQPLNDWLKNENAKYPDDPVGWQYDTYKPSTKTVRHTSAVVYLFYFLIVIFVFSIFYIIIRLS